jgi:hypothetical protein
MSPTKTEKIRDEALRRMLNTPHKPHAKPKKARKPKKKAAAK